MLRRCRTIVVCVALAAAAHATSGQEQAPVPADAPYEFVSGTVVELPSGKMVVNRAVLGKSPENHTFIITPETKVEGRLRVQARVTVGYKTTDEGDSIAVRVIVRPQSAKKP